MKSTATILQGLTRNEGYRDDRWKSFATGLKRDCGSVCESCRLGNRILHVHHLFYEPGREPWEYDTDDLIVLCEACHREIHEQLRNFRRYVFGKLNGAEFKILNGALAVGLEQYDPLVFCHALAEFVASPHMVERYAKAWDMDSATENNILTN